MKKIITLLALISTLITFSQVPQGISYQAIALNGSANPVVSSNVGIRLSVLDNSATGTVLYTETHTKTTNAQGLFNLVIGQGTPTTGTFSTINWGTNSKFLKVEMDAAGGTNYVLVGTTQLLSVPYAMTAGNLSGSSANDSIEDNKYSNFAFYDSSTDATYAFNQITGTWVSQAGGSPTSGTIVSSNGNFAFYDSSTDKTYAFNKKTGTWVSQNGGSPTSSTIVSSNGNFAFYDSSTDSTYVFNQNTSTWISQSGGSPTSGTIISSNGNFAFYDSSTDKTYAFNKKTGTWISQNGGSPTSGTIVSSNGNFAFYDSSVDTTYVFNKNTGAWIAQSGGSPTANTIVISSSN
ncbi:hypothetical protein [Flavobacterium sp.]|uniref:hypothetical protein n=1 Tax=Flavobacterium sp. TaxID=239 RepID=UPI002B4ABD1A|nr:hypothetical protein [Flavobacterium sp.]HLP63790.1 hypothetical protein [Flavobacterium sp.]